MKTWGKVMSRSCRENRPSLRMKSVVVLFKATDLDLQSRTTSRYGEGFLGGSVAKNPAANAEDTGSIPGPGSSHMPQSN